MDTAQKHYTAWDVPKINKLSSRDIHSQEIRTGAGVSQSCGKVRKFSIGNASVRTLISNYRERLLLEQHLGDMPALSQFAQGK